MPLIIVFLGWNARLTDQYLEQMAIDNAEQVARYNRRHGRLALKDGTVIFNAYHIANIQGWRIDQVILADDRRLQIKEHHRDAIARLMAHRQASIVPEEFGLQIYDIDEEE